MVLSNPNCSVILQSLRLSCHRISISPIPFHPFTFLVNWQSPLNWTCLTNLLNQGGPSAFYPSQEPAHLCGLMGSGWWNIPPPLHWSTCPEKSGVSFWPQGGRRRNTHLVQGLLEEQCFPSLSYTTPVCAKNLFKEHSTAECQPWASVGCFYNHGPVRSGGPDCVWALSCPVAQWAGEALALLPLRHQLQAADELGLAHTVCWTIAGNYKFWTLTCRNKWGDCSWCSLYSFVSALYFNRFCTISLFGCVVFWWISGRSWQLTVARSEGQEILGPLEAHCKILHKARRAKKLLWNASL